MSLNIGSWILKRAMAIFCSPNIYRHTQGFSAEALYMAVAFWFRKSDNNKIGSSIGWLHILFSEYAWHEEEIFISDTVVRIPILSWHDTKDLNSFETNIPIWTVRKQVCSAGINDCASQWACWCMMVSLAVVSSIFSVFCSRRIMECTLY